MVAQHLRRVICAIRMPLVCFPLLVCSFPAGVYLSARLPCLVQRARINLPLLHSSFPCLATTKYLPRFFSSPLPLPQCTSLRYCLHSFPFPLCHL
ncbi:hypothetical protein EDB19DRAFT_363828 [Suillus lakei]|nr:hypothetical protein EDB19DRAFT_363828 [Suillus lakei]